MLRNKYPQTPRSLVIQVSKKHLIIKKTESSWIFTIKYISFYNFISLFIHLKNIYKSESSPFQATLLLPSIIQQQPLNTQRRISKVVFVLRNLEGVYPPKVYSVNLVAERFSQNSFHLAFKKNCLSSIIRRKKSLTFNVKIAGILRKCFPTQGWTKTQSPVWCCMSVFHVFPKIVRAIERALFKYVHTSEQLKSKLLKT